MGTERARTNGTFAFNDHGEVVIHEKAGDMTREPWLMLLVRRGMASTRTLCWGLTNSGMSFARIGTQEGDLLNGFVHEDPYKARMLGNYTYIVDEENKYFSNCWYPVKNPGQELTCRFGFGYVVYRTSCHGLDTETTCFIPNGFDGMAQILKIRNTTDKPRKLKLFNIAPVNIGDARSIQFSGFNSLMLGGGIIDRQVDAIVWRNNFGIPVDCDDGKIMGMFGRLLVHGSSLPGSSYATRYEEFVGHYSNSMACPAALFEDALPDNDVQDLLSSLSTVRSELSLAPGEEREIVFSLIAAGTEDYYLHSKRDLIRDKRSVSDPVEARKLFEEVRADWEKELSKTAIELPGDKVFMQSFKWLQYQCSMVTILNRMKSRFHSGFEYGYGFRDILQDILAVLPYDSATVRALILYVCEQMFADGSVYHNFFVSAPGTRDFVACDDPLWLVYAVCEYVKETRDFGILHAAVPFADAKEGLAGRSGSVLDHCLAGIERVWDNSDEGLPVMMDADWNDDLSSYEEHRSVMAAQMLFKAFNDMADLLDAAGARKDLIATFRKRAIVVKKSVDTQAIESDGRYIRALSPDTSKAPHLGSLSSDKLIFFEPIAWSGFSGMADSAQFDKIMALCEKNLYDEFGVALCEGDRTLVEGKLPEDYSGWKRNAPGKKENGGEFRHLESWYIASLCAFGYGKKAYDLYRKTIPAITSEPDPFRYAAERFVYPEYVSSPSSAEHGRAGHTWLTGTAPTRLCVFLDSILGLKRGYEGLRIDPCVNPEWKRFKARRAFRSSDFMITYENPDGLEHGVGELRVDGAKIEGNLVPERFYDGKSHEILVMMAKP